MASDPDTNDVGSSTAFGGTLPGERRKCVKCGRSFRIPDDAQEKALYECPACLGTIPKSPTRVYVKDGHITCPSKGCDGHYPVSPDAEPQMGNCPKCDAEFLIVTPESELRPKPKAAERSESLLPQVKNLLTSTVMLDRSGAAMLPTSASALGDELPTVPIEDDEVACPGCGQKYPVTSDLSGKFATCSECSDRFVIG